MAKAKLTKSAVDAVQPQAQPVELRDNLVPGFLCKVTPIRSKGVHAAVPHQCRRMPQARSRALRGAKGGWVAKRHFSLLRYFSNR